MSLIATVAYALWFPIAILIFAEFRGTRGVVISMIAGWLFLPHTVVHLSGLPEITKSVVVSTSALSAALLFDAERIYSFRLRWYDGILFLFCIAGFFSSISNGLGLHDGLSSVFSRSLEWAVPYLLGRVYCRDAQSLRTLAIGIFIGGLAYIPFCLIEMRLSPQIHRWVYGFAPGQFSAERFGGYRPQVFLSQGLELGLWMTAASLCGYWLWRTKLVSQIWSVPIKYLVFTLLVVTVLCKAMGAILLLVLAIGILELSRLWRSAIPIVGTCVICVCFMSMRIANISGEEVLVDAAKIVSAERAHSLAFRFDNEDILIAKALQRPINGWGGWGRSRVYNEEGKDISITDGFWIIILGTNGFVGLVTVYSCVLFISAMASRRALSESWPVGLSAPTVLIAIIPVVYMIDCILNGMHNVVYPMCTGALAGILSESTTRLLPRATVEEELSSGIHKFGRRLIPGHPTEVLS